MAEESGKAERESRKKSLLSRISGLIPRLRLDLYPASSEAKALLSGRGNVKVQKIRHGLFLDGKGNDILLVFYPGARIEAEAYLPLMTELAEGGMDVCLLRMPLGIALLGTNRAAGALSHRSYAHRLVGGHSLGGVAAARFAAAHPKEVSGLLLLASYPDADLRGTGLRVLTLYGSRDKVLNRRNLEKAAALLPEGAKTEALPGGNHAQFACYGTQRDDGVPELSPQEQRKATVRAVLDFFSPDQ